MVPSSLSPSPSKAALECSVGALVPFGVTASELACKQARHATFVDEDECGGSDDCVSDDDSSDAAADDADGPTTADADSAAATAAVDAHLRAHCDVCPHLLRSEAVALAQRASTTLARVEARLRRWRSRGWRSAARAMHGADALPRGEALERSALLFLELKLVQLRGEGGPRASAWCAVHLAHRHRWDWWVSARACLFPRRCAPRAALSRRRHVAPGT